MLITYIIVDIFCIIIVEVIRKNLTADSGSEQEVKMLKYSLGCYFLFMIAGLIGLIVENGNLFYSKVVDYLANVVSLSALALSGFYWFMFVQLRSNKRFIATKWRILTYIPIIAVLFLCVSSPLTGWAFYIDQENCYRRGPLFLFVSVIPLLYDLASTITVYVKAFHEKQLSKRRQYFNLGSFIYFPLAASILQIWLSGMPILAPAIATAYYMVFSSIQGAMIYNDALTGMNNRRRAMIYMEEKLTGISQSNPLTVFMIDGDRFKLINDTYGHIEGDSAIVCMAEAIQSVCSKYNIFGARYGGDEFILIRTGECSFGMEAVGEEINDMLRQICEKKNKPYTLSVTAGSYTIGSNEESMDDIIAKADENLYKKKKERKS